MGLHILKSDLNRYFGKTDFKHLIKAFILIPGFRFSYFFRKSMHFKSRSRVLYYLLRFFHRHYSLKYSIDIPVTTRIGEGFYIGHLGNIVISGAATIGKFCNIAQGVTIGQTYRGDNAGAPIIGDYVWIGANSVVVGGITIGNDVMIAPLTFVNQNIPSHSIAIGNPMKIISREFATQGYINNVLYDQ
jgi:serine O-acetyltransferase